MIGGYIYSARDDGIDARLRELLDSSGNCVEVFDKGCFYYTNSFQADLKPHASSGDLMALSEDLLVAGSF